jgi:hypothetical protein
MARLFKGLTSGANANPNNIARRGVTISSYYSDRLSAQGQKQTTIEVNL